MFEKKTVLITGAASGIGFLASKCFAREGANVFMVDVDKERLSASCEIIRKDGGSIAYKVADVTKYEEVFQCCKAAFDCFESLDVTISCAGGSAARIKGLMASDFIDVPIDVYDWGMDLNFKHPFYLGYAAMKYMAQQKSGVIINIGSVTGEEGSAVSIDYAASKSGVMYGLTKSLAMAGAKYGIRVCCVSPGPVLTRKNMAEMPTLLQRAADPQEIVDLIMFLASEKASFITGTNYFIDGGRLVLRNKEGRNE